MLCPYHKAIPANQSDQLCPVAVRPCCDTVWNFLETVIIGV